MPNRNPEKREPKIVPLDDFVEEIRRISEGVITKQRLCDLMRSRVPAREDLRSFERWMPERHSRNLIFRNDLIELMLICWNVGDTTPAHTHNGQLGWMTMLEGRLLVENMRLVRCNAPENQQVVGIDCLTGATEIEMESVSREVVEPGGPLNTVDKTQTIHRISNPPEWNERALSLHVYSLPIESCVVFDLENQRCTRRELSYDNV
ncbi:MAG: cysteine dioxygenase family protein [Thermoanaerobaculia bacterium]|nr:cysteine dioxygenase family protein [Thermoanaerobaculia bacterium]